MSSHWVVCYECKDRRGRTPKQWEWLCDTCAEEHADKHRAETGHKPELRITSEPTIANLKRDIRTANLISRRKGW